VAAPAEARAVLSATGANPAMADHPWFEHSLSLRLSLVVTGIGKANAAGAVARVFDPGVHAGVLSLGVAGALPGTGLTPGNVIAASESVYADEGLESPGGFTQCAALGFALGPPPIAGPAIPAHPALLDALTPLADAVGPIATVSTCAGTGARARAVRARTGALAEAMEGAAALQAAVRVGGAGPLRGELRVISNTTGDRAAQRWDLAAALARLEAVARSLRELVG